LITNKVAFLQKNFRYRLCLSDYGSSAEPKIRKWMLWIMLLKLGAPPVCQILLPMI